MASTTRHPIRIAVVGCGYWGRNHVRNYAEIGALEAVVDADAARAAEMAQKHGARAMSFEDALADPILDAMVFALPPSQNHPMGLRAMAAGKHLFLEKPIALASAHAEELRDEAERLELRLMVGHILRFHPAFLRLEWLVRAGELGHIRTTHSSRLNLGLVRPEEDAWWALAPHDLSMILALTGSEPMRIAASGGFHLQPGIADLVHADLSFPGGTNAHVFVSWLHPFKEQKLTVVGSKAMAVFDDTQPWDWKLVLYRHRFERRGRLPVPHPAEAEPVPLEAREPLREQCLHFLDCVATGKQPRTDGAEAMRVLKVLEAGSRSVTERELALPGEAAISGAKEE